MRLARSDPMRCTHHRSNWTPAWREPGPKPDYDVIIVGGGGHGLATAYYLAKEHGITNVAVLEKGWLGSGNVGRNTTIIRSNYLLPGNNPFYEWSMKLWEGLEQDFNFNAMVVAARRPQSLPLRRRSATPSPGAATPCGCTASTPSCSTATTCGACCRSSTSTMRASRSWAACLQRRGGTVRHDAVAWGYARGADSRGVDIIQNCEVTGIRVENGTRHRRRDQQGLHRLPEARPGRGRQFVRASPRWPA